jgi:hypothetical protein
MEGITQMETKEENHINLFKQKRIKEIFVIKFLFSFYISVNSFNENVCSDKTNCTTNNKDTKTKQRHVTKIKRSLKKAIHLCSSEKEEDGIQKDIKACTSTRKEASPSPSIREKVKRKLNL